VVETRALTRRFDDRMAVDGLTLTVGAGEIVTLLGPNGAGKTTTFRMLAGLLAPTSGEVTIAGTRLTASSAEKTRSRVGLLTESPGLWERLSVRWNLRTYAALHGVPDAEARVAKVMDAVGIGDRADDRAGALSKGLKQRVALARALVHDPPVVLLDEPTSGLDPASARHVRGLIRQMRDEGRAVMVSTHNLAEAEALSDRIAVLNTRLLACDTPRRLREERRAAMVVIEVDGEAADWSAAAQEASGVAAVVDGSTLALRVADPDTVPDIVSALVTAGARIRRVEPRHPTLEDAYLALVRDDG
jgi:ABC-2 type transport system ATP-binding protein